MYIVYDDQEDYDDVVDEDYKKSRSKTAAEFWEYVSSSYTLCGLIMMMLFLLEIPWVAFYVFFLFFNS